MLNYVLKLFITIGFAICTTASIAQSEIVRRLDGSLVYLNRDRSWEPIYDNFFAENKLEVSIYDATNWLREFIEDDGFGKVTYEYSVGCKYSIQVQNKTNFDAAVGRITLQSDLYMHNEIVPHSADFGDLFEWTPVKSGESIILRGLDTYDDIMELHDKVYETPISDLEETNLYRKYGCEFQRGHIFVVSERQNYFVKFEPKAGIPDTVAGKFVVPVDGVAPLQRRIRYE